LALWSLHAEDGSRLWLRHSTEAAALVTTTHASAVDPTVSLALKELRQGWRGQPVDLRLEPDDSLGEEGFKIENTALQLRLTAAHPQGLLYGAFHLLRLQECGREVHSEQQKPVVALRILNHWDNPDGTVERGYAGRSLWDWGALPDSLSSRYAAYARANASVGINGTVLNNVNASPTVLCDSTLHRVRALADVFRPYGLRVYLSVNFATPMALGELTTADPLNPDVRRWWRNKVAEIYRLIPDFGGFLVKANSEGQPGPCDFGRTHADGANMLAEALQPYGGLVMWRAFVYNPGDADRAKQATAEFAPLDGKFLANVVVQVKNGPIDFQPREPAHPLFYHMPHTALMAEWQITQEYLGQANHLVYLAPMWREFLAEVPVTSMQAVAGVANIGTDVNWCGHPFAAANWYAFGRLTWQPSLTADSIATEWVAQTFGTEPALAAALVPMMSASREAAVNYMMPMGLHHLFAWGHHYGPEPWCNVPGARADWLPPYYHKADAKGIGFDRTASGSNAVAQYPDSVARLIASPATCPERWLLWFHHLPWGYELSEGRSLWDELCLHYQAGVDAVRDFRRTWIAVRPYVDAERYADVARRLQTQEEDAVWWRDACLLYFRTFARRPFPDGVETPKRTLEELQHVQLPISNYECPSSDMLRKWR
jgi:alpha-glucuronidase